MGRLTYAHSMLARMNDGMLYGSMIRALVTQLNHPVSSDEPPKLYHGIVQWSDQGVVQYLHYQFDTYDAFLAMVFISKMSDRDMGMAWLLGLARMGCEIANTATEDQDSFSEGSDMGERFTFYQERFDDRWRNRSRDKPRLSKITESVSYCLFPVNAFMDTEIDSNYINDYPLYTTYMVL